MSNKVRYSVVIPSYYGKENIVRVITSLARQSISYSLFEVIVVDDNTPLSRSIDQDSLRLLFPFLQIKLMRLPRRMGSAAARNVGVQMSEGDIIFFTDDDCEVPALWIEQHLEVYKAHPEVSGVGGWYKVPLKVAKENVYELFIYSNYEINFSPLSPYSFNGKSSEISPEFKEKFPGINTANLSIKRGVFLSVQGFNEQYIALGMEDVAFVRSILDRGYIIFYLPQMVLHTKQHSFKMLMWRALQRGAGNYIDRSLRQDQKSIFFLEIFRRYKSYIQWVSRINMAAYKKRRRLIWIGFLYYGIMYSRLFTFYYKRILKKGRRRVMLSIPHNRVIID